VTGAVGEIEARAGADARRCQQQHQAGEVIRVRAATECARERRRVQGGRRFIPGAQTIAGNSAGAGINRYAPLFTLSCAATTTRGRARTATYYLETQ
jgi:hypothetical protein